METMETENIFANNPALLNAIQGRLGSLVGRPSGYIESLPPEVKRRIKALKNIQSEQLKYEKQYRAELAELEKKYLKIYEPLFEKRSSIVNGKVEPTDAECEREDSDMEQDAEEKPEVKKEEKPSADPVKGIPEFWLTCLKTNAVIAELITERDEEPLKALTDIQLQYLDDSDGFKLSFFFNENEYFTNKVLTKIYRLENTGDYGNIIDGKAEGCDINWNEGKNLTVTVETKKQRRKGTNQTRIIKRTIPAETFFSFFNPPVIPDNEALEMDEDEMQELDNKLEADYEVGEIIKDKIIPYAVDWFTGNALEFEEAEFDSDEYDGYDDEEEDDDDEDVDDTENAKGLNEPNAQAPECKQQ
jgi:nucleosome assembly protein 1-like 1